MLGVGVQKNGVRGRERGQGGQGRKISSLSSHTPHTFPSSHTSSFPYTHSAYPLPSALMKALVLAVKS
ncbi:MAG: hypothetical protein V7K47_28815 [Nostoc sp.]